MQSGPRGVQLVLRNLLLADWFDEDHSESFLNQRRSKRSRELLQNVRKACCVAGQFHIEARPLPTPHNSELYRRLL